VRGRDLREGKAAVVVFGFRGCRAGNLGHNG
jgi:hypothetical protein